jgi:hypothetical protein
LLEFAVPFALVILLLDITLVYHASRTGRLQPWAFIILMIPGIGALAYIVVELVPEMLSGPGASRHAAALPTGSIRKSCIVNYPIGSPPPIPSPTALRWPPSV